MSAPPPEANPEYSRGSPLSNAPAMISRGLLAGGLIGALLILIAEFTPLYTESSVSSRLPLHTVNTGSHHGHALIPVAVLATLLVVAAARWASRPALLALGALGILAVLIALLGDLPAADQTGLVGSATAGYTKAKDVPQIGLYLETLGAVLLVITCGAGLLLTGSASARSARSPRVGRGLSAP